MFRKDLIESVLLDLKKDGYLDDNNFADAFVRERLAKRKSGQNKIRAELIKRGINQKSIDVALTKIDNTSFEQTAINLVDKKLKSLKQKESDIRKIKQKISSFLFSKGFETDIIFKVINQLKLDEDDYTDL